MKIIKYFFKSLSEAKSISRYVPKTPTKKNLLNLISKKPILPSSTEVKQNPPSRSAKLRFAIRNNEIFKNSNELFEKFKSYIELEMTNV